MKILYHHRTASKDGQAVHIEELTTALRQLGHEVIVVGPAATVRQSFGGHDKTTHRLKRFLPKVAYEILEFSYALLAYRRLVAAYREHRPEVLYERSCLFMPAGVWLKRKFGLPLLLEVNAPLAAERNEVDGIAFYRLARWSEEMTWRHADIVLPVTQVLASTIERAGVPRDRIVVNPNGIDPKRFECRLDRDQAKTMLGLSDRLVLGFTGFVRDWHGLEMVIDLLGDLHEEWPCHLLVVGDGPALASLEARARERGVADQVTFTGLVGRDAITDMIRAFDVALQPAVRAYASPLKLVEYMAMECAVVAPRTPNIEEVLTDGQTAILFEPGDLQSFRAALRELCGSSALRRRIGSAARLAILEKGLTWEHNARRVEGLIVQLLAGTGRRSKAPS